MFLAAAAPAAASSGAAAGAAAAAASTAAAATATTAAATTAASSGIMASISSALFGSAASAGTAATSGFFGTAGQFGLGTALMNSGTLLSTVGALGSARAMSSLAGFNSDLLESSADDQIAAGQREALEQKRQANLAMSRAQAVAAASGGGAADPTVINVIGDIAAEGEYSARVADYTGRERARNTRLQAAVEDAKSDMYEKSGYVNAAGTLLSGFSKTYGGMGSKAINPGTTLSTANTSTSSMFAKYGSSDYPQTFYATNFYKL